ncbi:MAG: hypothetical protein EAY70_02845 [Sphingomonadales bacterium]|nr:MAG: hypothetical protein EAY70_02845 [Sphingomonadales bacterium]
MILGSSARTRSASARPSRSEAIICSCAALSMVREPSSICSTRSCSAGERNTIRMRFSLPSASRHTRSVTLTSPAPSSPGSGASGGSGGSGASGGSGGCGASGAAGGAGGGGGAGGSGTAGMSSLAA